MQPIAHQLQERIVSVIERGVTHAMPDTAFNGLALDIFGFQFEHNPVYQAYCRQQERTPGAVKYWEEIPAVPTAAYKDLTVSCFPPNEVARVFHTSGTTQEATGKHYFKTLDIYHAAALQSFASHLLPDQCSLPMFILTPAPDAAPHSSLSYMMGAVAAALASAATFYIQDNTVRLAQLVTDLHQAQRRGYPVFLLGTTFAFVRLIDYCVSECCAFELPAASRIMETGGYKGRGRQVTKPKLYNQLSAVLGIPGDRIVNEYGMTELSTQFYDETMLLGRRSDVKRVPPWARIQIIDPRTGNPAAPDETGMIRITDLANLGSSICIQTDDLGVARPNGFEILGRISGATVRGCSLTAESLARSS